MIRLECRNCMHFNGDGKKCDKKKSVEFKTVYKQPCWKYRGKHGKK